MFLYYKHGSSSLGSHDKISDEVEIPTGTNTHLFNSSHDSIFMSIFDHLSELSLLLVAEGCDLLLKVGIWVLEDIVTLRHSGDRSLILSLV